MRTEKVNIYKLEELSEDAQQTAIENNWTFNVEGFDWWQFIYEDAEQVDLKIKGFDIDRGYNIDIEFNYHADDTAEEILKHHGEGTDTYKLAKEFLEAFRVAEKDEEKYNDLYEDIAPENEDEEELEAKYYDLMGEAQERMDDLCDEFLKDLGNEYLEMLKNDYEWRTSEEAIKESIIANEMEFTEEGHDW